MSQIHMSCEKSASLCFPGGISHGYAKCVVPRQELANFNPREKTLMHQIFIYLVIFFPCVPPQLTHIYRIVTAMAFVTYILLAALQSGLQSRFHPEIFGVVATKAIVVILLDFLFVKGGCYLLGVQASSPIVDLLAYGGYKFIGYVTHVNDFVVKLSIFSE